MIDLLTEYHSEITIFLLGATILILVFSFLQWVQVKDRSLLFYALFNVINILYYTRNTSIVHALSNYFGITEIEFWRYTEATLGAGMSLLFIVFIYEFLGLANHLKQGRLRIIIASCWLIVSVIITDWFLLLILKDLVASANLQIIAQSLIYLAHLYVIFAAFSLNDKLSRIIFMGYFIPMTLSIIGFTFLGIGENKFFPFPTDDITPVTYGATALIIQINLFIQNLFFLYAIIYRYSQYQYERDKAYRDLLLERQETWHLKEMEAQKNQFFTNITHEFRTPLSIILGNAEQLVGNPSKKQHILRNGEQLLNLINQLLDLAKLNAGVLKPNYVQGNIISFLKFLIDAFRSLALSKKQSFAFYSHVDCVLMDFDPEKIPQIASNLIINAIKFTPEYGEVAVIVERNADRLIFEVRDNGPGIPPEKIPHIFDRFYQADDSSTRQGEGTGIGLALVKELVDLLDGEIAVNSEPGRGTTFSVILPIRREAARGDPLPEIKPSGITCYPFKQKITRTISATDDKPLLLIIEDNLDVITHLDEFLQKYYQILYARNGKEGLRLARENPVEVILCDVMMPEMDGVEVCKEIRADIRTKYIPLIMITAKASQRDKVDALAAGADAYLIKPFDKEELLIRINNLLNHSRMESEFGQTQKEKAFLNKLDKVIQDNIPNESFNVNYLCLAMKLGRPTLHKKVKALTGYSPGKYLSLRRLAMAKELLEKTELNISEVAYQVGFKTPAHFSTVFKAHFGISPSDFFHKTHHYL